MEIEDTVQRKSYRDFDLVHLRHGSATKTRWRITQKESGMNRSYGFAPSEIEAHLRIDAILKQSPDERRTQAPR
jgi:hypothetical protein